MAVADLSSVFANNSEFSHNRAQADGQCSRITDDRVMCPAVLGAGVSVIRGELWLTNCSIDSNYGACRNSFGTRCDSDGGALALSLGGAVSVLRSRLTRNMLNCSDESGCVLASGAGSGSVQISFDFSSAFVHGREEGKSAFV